MQVLKMLNQNYKDAINFLDSPQRYGNHGDLKNISMVLRSFPILRIVLNQFRLQVLMVRDLHPLLFTIF